jgi:O-antigen/teichoic acid export membrane protein
MQSGLKIFLSGRLALLVLVLALQILIVRLLPALEYGRLALVFGVAVLMQTVISFGIPKLIPRYIGQAGWGISARAARRLIWAMLGFRLVATAALLASGWAVGIATGIAADQPAGYLTAGFVYILVSLVQVDGDAMTQALNLQRNSRAVSVGEALCRLLLVWTVAFLAHERTAAAILSVSIVTAGTAAAINVRAVLRAIAATEPQGTAPPLDRREFRSVALAGYASAMTWFATSSATIRLLAARSLDIVTFAGFSFVQTLTLSFQRYTPGQLLLPFVEPAAVRHYLQTGNQDRLAAALSLLVKLDLILIGAAAVGAAVSGDPIISLLAHGRYGAMATALPWLLAYVFASSVHRAFEVVAVSIGATRVLYTALPISLAWLALAIVATPRLGIVVLLAVPIADAVSRLAMTEIALRRQGVSHLIDLSVTALLLGAACGTAIAGRTIVQALGSGPAATIAIGVGASAAFLALALIARPLRRAEVGLLLDGRAGPVADRALAFARA